MRMRPIPSTGGRYWAGEDGRVDDADFADCEAMCAEAPPPRPLLGDACRIEVLMGEAARVFERLERKGVRL